MFSVFIDISYCFFFVTLSRNGLYLQSFVDCDKVKFFIYI